jgi:hypothetical protein
MSTPHGRRSSSIHSRLGPVLPVATGSVLEAEDSGGCAGLADDELAIDPHLRRPLGLRAAQAYCLTKTTYVPCAREAPSGQKMFSTPPGSGSPRRHRTRLRSRKMRMDSERKDARFLRTGPISEPQESLPNAEGSDCVSAGQSLCVAVSTSAPEGTRTPNLLIRRETRPVPARISRRCFVRLSISRAHATSVTVRPVPGRPRPCVSKTVSNSRSGRVRGASGAAS